MLKALVIALVFWVAIIPVTVGSFLILRFLFGSDPALYFFLVAFAVCVSGMVIVFGLVLFPAEVASEFDSRFDSPQITSHQEERNAHPYDIEVGS